MDFPIYTTDTAPEASKAALAQAKATLALFRIWKVFLLKRHLC